MKITVPENGAQYLSLIFWEVNFREQASLLKVTPPHGIDPELVKMLIDSNLSVADEMAEAIAAYNQGEQK